MTASVASRVCPRGKVKVLLVSLATVSAQSPTQIAVKFNYKHAPRVTFSRTLVQCRTCRRCCMDVVHIVTLLQRFTSFALSSFSATFGSITPVFSARE